MSFVHSVMYTVLSLSLIRDPQLSDYLHHLTPCYIQTRSLLYGVSPLSTVCLLCKQCTEPRGHSEAYGRQSGRRCERADVRGERV